MRRKILTVLLAGLCSNVWAEEAEMLEEITVTATRTEMATKEAPSSVTIVSRQDIARKGAENILEAIQGTPGITLQGIGTGGRKTISLRGMESKHTLILVDGKRIPSTNDVIGPNTDYQYDWVPIGQIERIEVVRGPMSALYGADALGGVINVITHKPDNNLTGEARLASRTTDGNQGGDGHDVILNLSSGVRDNLQLNISGQQSRRAAVDSKLTPNTSAIEGQEKQQLDLGINWQPADDHNIRLEHNTGNEKRWYDTVTRTGTPYQSSYDIDRQQTSLGWEGRVGSTKSKLRTYQSDIDISNSATNGVTPTDPQKLQEQVVEGSTAFAGGEKQFITVGAEHRTEKLTHPKLPNGQDEASVKSIFAQDEIELSERTYLTLGARQDDHDAFGSEISPRASIVWDANEQLTLKASYGHGFRAPTLKQVAPGYSFPAGRFIIKSNPDLKPETSDAIELGANYATGKLELNAAVFDNKVKNLIDTRFNQNLPGGLQEWIYDNIDEANMRGAELSTKLNVTGDLKLTGNYQYLDARDGNGQRLERRPRHTLSVGTEWEKNGWQTSLSAEHLADQTIVPPATGMMTDLPDYTIWNAGVRKSVNKHLEVAAGIDNLTNVRLEDKSPDFRHEEYPRTLRLEVRGEF